MIAALLAAAALAAQRAPPQIPPGGAALCVAPAAPLAEQPVAAVLPGQGA